MKLSGILGKGSGKLGEAVFTVSGGEQVVRQYTSQVANPNTPAQVNQRARLKLGSQLAAALAPVIAIPREGLKSSRNLFLKKNFGNILAENGVASAVIDNLQLTNGSVALPQITATRTNQSIAVALATSADASVSRVVWILYKKTEEAKLQYIASVIAEEAGANGTFAATLPATSGEIVFFAYGARDLSAAATAKYGDLQAQTGTDMAQLVTSRTISASDMQLTMTRGTTMAADVNEVESVPDGYARVFVNVYPGLEGGTVEGGGVYEIGSEVTLRATATVEGKAFSGWWLANAGSGSGSRWLGSANPYTFVLEHQMDILGSFE